MAGIAAGIQEEPYSIYGRRLTKKDPDGGVSVNWASLFDREAGIAASLPEEQVTAAPTVTQNQLKTMAMADDARLSIATPSQPPAPNKPVTAAGPIGAAAAKTPTFTNNAQFAAQNGLAAVQGIDGVMGNQQLTGEGGLKMVPDAANVKVVGKDNYVAGPAGADGASQGITAPSAAPINSAPTSGELTANLRLGSDFGSIKAIQTAGALATDMFNRQQANIETGQKQDRINQNARELDIRQQGIAAEAPNRAAQARLYTAQANAAEYAASPEARSAEAAKLQKEQGQKDAELYQKYYESTLSSMKDDVTMTAEQKQAAAAQQAQKLVGQQRYQEEVSKLTPEQRQEYDQKLVVAKKQQQRKDLQTAYAAAQAKGDIALQEQIAAKMSALG